jgi:hypothetical protein
MAKTDWTGQLPMAFFPDQNGNMGKLETAFWEFHKKNPRVYGLLLLFAIEWRQGHGANARLGIAALFERVRWEMSLGKKSDQFKLNNNYRAFYARLIMDNNPLLKELFSVRRQRIQSTIGPPNDTLASGKHVA